MSSPGHGPPPPFRERVPTRVRGLLILAMGLGPGVERLMREARPVDGKYSARALVFFYAPIVLLTIGTFLHVKMRLAAMGFVER